MATDKNRKISKLFIIPQRYILAIMCCISVTIAHAVRYGFPVALIFLTVPANKTQIRIGECLTTKEIEFNSTDTEINVEKRYKWTEVDQYLIKISFFLMYPVCQIVGGVVSDQYGGKHTLDIPILIVMLITFITPSIIVGSEGDRNVLIIIRAMTGLIQGWILPSVYSILSQWVPKCERTFIASLSIIGVSLGKAMANYVTKQIILSTKYWRSGFYLYGLMSLIWLIIWNLLCYSSPRTHPFISDKEKEYLERKLNGQVFLGRKKIPFWSIFMSMPLWATVLVQFGHMWISFAMIDAFPVFVRIKFRIHEKENIDMDTLPHLVLVPFCLICGFFSDLILNKNYLTISTMRKVLTTVGSMGPSIFILSASLLECNRDATLWMFCTGVVLKSAFFASSDLNSLDLAPNFAGILKGIVNTFTVFVGVIGPEIENQISNAPFEREEKEWRLIFLIAFVIMALTNFAYVLIGDCEEQVWNKLELNREGSSADFKNSIL